MEIVLAAVVPVFGVAFIGFSAAKIGLINDKATDGLSRFVFVIAVPIMLFRTMASIELPDVTPWSLLLSYYLGGLGVFGIGMLSARILFDANTQEQGVMGFSCIYSNAVLLGIPLLLAALGERAALPLFLVVACQGPIFFTLGTVIVEASLGHRDELRKLPAQVLSGLLRNGIVVGIALGISCNLLRVPIPATLDAVVSKIAIAAPACALVALGASLNQYRINGDLREPLLIVGLKNFLHPLTVWILATQVFSVPSLWATVIVVMATLPTGVNAFVFANNYKIKQSAVSRAIALSTLVSLFTLSAVLAVMAGS